MKRTEWLQETRKMRFEDAYGGWQGKRLTQEEAAKILGVSDRTFRRYVDRYEDSGLEGLVDKRLSQDSHRRAPVDEVMALQEMYRQHHSDWNAKGFSRLEHITLNYRLSIQFRVGEITRRANQRCLFVFLRDQINTRRQQIFRSK